MPKNSATLRAAFASGASASNPIENECKSLPFSFNKRAAIDDVKDESNPPESNTPIGTSLIKRLRVASVKASLISNNSSSFVALVKSSYSGL